jgi:formylglycine-generating enzyme required for sulfatase activity
MTFSSDPRWARIIQVGEDHRLAAQDAAGSRPREAAAHARAAMDCFMAPLVWQVKLNQTGDMVFVPPGAVQTPAGPQLVRGFFMDRHEVTLGAFAEFVRQANWRSLNAAGAPDLPAFNVTFYDAQAYAAHQGKRLPTDAQWSLAASYGLGQPEEGGDAGGQGGAYGRQDAILPPGSRPGDVISQLGLADMAGNVAEWTRTTAGPATEGAEPWFGVPMVVRGAWGEPGGPQALQERRQMEYGASHNGLGFRCVYNLPDPARAVDDLLAR